MISCYIFHYGYPHVVFDIAYIPLLFLISAILRYCIFLYAYLFLNFSFANVNNSNIVRSF